MLDSDVGRIPVGIDDLEVEHLNVGFANE